MATPSKHPDVIDIPGEICNLWQDFRSAVGFLTCLPGAPPFTGPLDGESEARATGATGLRRATAFFPLVGAGIGFLAGLMLLSAFELGLHPLTCALIGLASAAILTRAIHEDGLADFADGLGAFGPVEKRLDVMRDSRIGTFGTLAAIFGIGIRASILSGLSSPELAVAALVAAGSTSRAVLPAAMRWQRPARDDGLSAEVGVVDWPQVATAALTAFVVAVLAVGFSIAVAITVGAAMAALLVALVAQRVFGGQTGDVLGAMQVMAEIVVLAAVAMLE